MSTVAALEAESARFFDLLEGEPAVVRIAAQRPSRRSLAHMGGFTAVPKGLPVDPRYVRLPKSAQMVLLYLASKWSPDTPSVYITPEAAQADLGLHPETRRAALRALVKSGLVSRVGGSADGHVQRYRLEWHSETAVGAVE